MLGRTSSRLHRAAPTGARWASALVGWGSHSGTASFLADQLADELTSAGVSARAVDQREVTLDTLANEPADCVRVFVNACFGEGEPTDNAKALYDALLSPEREAEARKAVTGMPFAVFGLGASRTHSANYQVVARRLDARLAELGGRRVLGLGEGDDSGDVVSDFEAWQEQLLPEAKALTASTVAEEKGRAAQPAAEAGSLGAGEAVSEATAFDYWRAAAAAGLTSRGRVARIERVSAAPSPRAVYRVAIDSDEAEAYSPGDQVAILPRPLGHARALAAALGLEGPSASRVAEQAAGVEMTAPLPAGTFRQVAARLAAAGAPEGMLPALGRRAPLLDVLREAAPWLRGMSEGEAAALVAGLPPVRPRLYSVASNEGPIELLVRRVLRPRAAGGDDAVGVCSGWVTGTEESCEPAPGCALHGLEAAGSTGGAELAMTVRDAHFRLPPAWATPLVMVAGGVGLAPFVGFWRARAKAASQGAFAGPAVLLRCAVTADDLMLGDELRAALDDGVLGRVVDVVADGTSQPGSPGEAATSRLVDGALCEPATAEMIRETLGPGGKGHFYVCGGAGGFGTAVQEGVKAALGEAGAVDRLFAEGRWHEDLAD